MSHVGTLLVVILGTLGWGFALLLSLPLIVMSPMVFDAPGSERIKSNWFFVGWLLSCPPLVLIAVSGAWLSLLRGHDAAALWFCAIPLVRTPALLILVQFA